MQNPTTLFHKIWNNHVVIQEPGSPCVLYIDLHLLHEVTSPQAFNSLRNLGLKVRQPERTIATIDHVVPTRSADGSSLGRLVFADAASREQIQKMEENCRQFGITLFGLDSPNQGVIHIIAPEMGFTQPGMTIVCGDSHTATHGAFGALAFGIGTSEVEHVLATQCLLQYEPKTCLVQLDGRLPEGVTAKDIILALIAKIGVGGGQGFVFEYSGSAIISLGMEGRMTVCNMSIEAGARAGIIEPDHTTIEYIARTPRSPKGMAWNEALVRWGQLHSDEGAAYDKTVTLDVSTLAPMITFGTNPGMAIQITAPIPNPEDIHDPVKRASLEKSLQYMGLRPGEPLLGHKVDIVFIGSCTNGRLSDLRLAASVLNGRKVASGTRVLIVPGSQLVKTQAQAEGLDRIFIEAGAEWREPGCSMCLAMNGDQLEPGQYSVSTSNRNFEGRQGRGGRTFLASPLTAAATAINGKISDVRKLITYQEYVKWLNL